MSIFMVQMIHAHVTSMQLEESWHVEYVSYEDQIELELVDVITNLGRYAKIYPNKAMSKEQLLIDLSCC